MIYPADFESKIGYDRIRKILNDNCLSSLGKDILSEASFMTDRDDIEKEVRRVYEFQQLSEKGDNFPLDHFYDMNECIRKLRTAGSYPEVIEVFNLRRSLATLKAIHNFIKIRNSDKKVYPFLEELTGDIKVFPFLTDSIDRILTKEGIIRDKASPELAQIRSEIRRLNSSVSRKLQTVLKQSQAEGLVEKGTSVAIRNGRGVIPVSVYDKNKISGLIHDQSASGKTVFIEPEEVVAMNNRIIDLEYDEKREIIKILVVFADSIRPYLDDLEVNYRLLGEIDYVRARAMLGIRLSSVCPIMAGSDEMEWERARHPLLTLAFADMDNREVMPLDIKLDANDRILLISGPNAGGKSVCLKTVGLLQYMLQCGLTVPVREGSCFRIFNKIFIDIGDEQSIENDLSTYSSHLLNMKHFLRYADNNTLILIDEFGTGTEPTLGAAIAEAVLMKFNEAGLFGVLTTHYSNLKHLASDMEGIVNGAMMFDNHRMQPLFRLDIGKPGSSFAFEIARKIGLPEEILSRAKDMVGEEHIDYDRHLKDILRDKRYWDKKRQKIRVDSKKLDELVLDYEKAMAELKTDRREIIDRARQDADNLLTEANKQVERTIKEIKESQAEKERTREARKKLKKATGEMLEEKKDDAKIENKIRRLKEKEKKLKHPVQRSKRPDEAREKEKLKTGPLKKGDLVILKGTSSAGEITDVKGDKVTLATGNIITTVATKNVERVSKNEYNRVTRRESSPGSLDWEVTKRRSRFKPDIDVRGMRAEQALEKVRELVDEAIMVQYADLRILHGKGDGILRHLIREYLSSVDLVKDYRDEHVEAGGTGVTIVKLDL